MKLISALIIWSALLFLPIPTLALAPENLIIVYNRNLPESQTLARYYVDKRQVPVGQSSGCQCHLG